MKNWRKIIALVLAVLLISVTLIACQQDDPATNGGGDEATGDDGVTTSGENVTIRYAFWQATLEPYYNIMAAEFNEMYPNITIEIEPTAWGDYWTMLETAITAGGAADVFHMNGPNLKKYADAGVLMGLDSYISASGMNLGVFPAAMNDMYNFNGSQYGIVMDYDTIGLFYNKELFDLAGIDYPDSSWTWDDLVSAAAAITGIRDGAFGIAANLQDQQGFYNTGFAEGGWFVQGGPGAETFGFNDSGTRAGIQVWVDLLEAGYSPTQLSLEENEGYLQFMAGNLGMIVSGSWLPAFYSGEDSTVADVYDVAELPLMSSGRRASVIHGKGNCVFSDTANPNEAWLWVEFLSGERAQRLIGEMGLVIPAYTGMAQLMFDTYPNLNMGIFADAAENYSYPFPTSLDRPDWGDVYWAELLRAFNLEISVDEACDNIMAELG